LENIDYIGEQPLWGQIGHLSVLIAFVTALFGVAASIIRTKSEDLDGKWKTTSRMLYGAHVIAVVSIFMTLLLMLINHRFEYQYVWQHSKRDLNMNYILAALWEGQEGSTLLWLFWHAILGVFIIRRGGEWEAPVVGVISLVQVFLSIMLIGWYIGDTHIGSSPFTLIRLREENIGLPWTNIPDYLQKIPMFQDGRGLNPLLQNYWMTIHPPTLFCGFALVTIPFAYALAGLWTGKIYSWQKPALTWAFIGIVVLGTGILMGGAWAYESLSFGGFWAWDPVENASLVPWMLLVGAAHVMLIYKIKGQSLFTTFLLTIASFLLIVYSTFLTKSGILSETSVHAFTEDGLNEELTAYMGFFLWLSVVLMSRNRISAIVYTAVSVFSLILFLNGSHAVAMLILMLFSIGVLIIAQRRAFPHMDKEEELWSREFWMFIGALVLVVAAFQIAFWTSAPVINKFLAIDGIHNTLQSIYNFTEWSWMEGLVNHKLAPDKNVIYFYNSWQIPFAVLISILMAVTQFLKYRNSKIKEVMKALRWPFLISLGISIALGYFLYFGAGFGHQPELKQNIWALSSVLVFATIFAIAGNATYWKKVFKGKIMKAGASIAHIGFAMLLLGAVISTSKKNTISVNTSGMDVRSISQEGSNEENIYLRRGDTLPMGDYMVTYSSRKWEVRNGTDYVLFNVDFHKRNQMESGEKVFTLSPFIQLNPMMGNAAEPDTRHELFKDVYSYVKFVPMSSLDKEVSKENVQKEEYDQPRNFTVAQGDTIFADNGIIILDSITRMSANALTADTNVIGITAHFTITDRTMSQRYMTASYVANKETGSTSQIEAVDEKSGTKLIFWKVNPQNGKIDVYASTKKDMKPDYVVIEVSEFPAINILWLGCFIMIIGTVIAIRERMRKNKVPADDLTPSETA
jgi:cytochrome c-type biogenesis protein CcmF